MITDHDETQVDNSHWEYYNNQPEVHQKAKLLNMSVADMVKEFSELTGQKSDAALYTNLITEEYEEWCDEVFLHNLVNASDVYKAHKELKELSDLVYVIYGYARARGWDLDEAVRRVHKNNIGRCLQPDGTVKRRDDGKILKNPEYPKVDLKDLV